MTGPYSVHSGGIERPTPAGFRWPGGRRLAVNFRFAFEWWSDGHWPGTSPMGNPLKGGVMDLNAIGWAEYGHRRGVNRLLETFARHGVRGTVVVSGIMAERYPEAVKRIHDAGHEVAAHSYAMDVIPAYLDEAAERDNIRRTVDLIERATGVRPEGWVSPRGTPSANTGRLLAEEGFLWHGDTLNDDLPYLVEFGAHSIVAIPSTMEINDLPLYMRHGQSPRQLIELFDDWLAYGRVHDHEVLKIDPTVHAHVFGRPIGAMMLDRLLETATAADDLWIATRGDVARHLLESMG